MVVGLGNPGAEYEGTRHNAGFWLADALASRWNLPAWTRQRGARSTAGALPFGTMYLLKPQTFMNNSGALLAALRVAGPDDTLPHLLVLVDDFALEAGSFRLRASGSAGGHNGLRSVEQALGTRHYCRLRIGVGPKPAGADQVDFVLGTPSADERERITAALPLMGEAVECWAAEGIERAMARYNRRMRMDQA